MAVIAPFVGYKSTDELTLRKIILKNGDGMELSRRNDRLRATRSIFDDSMATNPLFSKDLHRLENYVKLTTAILTKIGHESIPESYDIYGHVGSVDPDHLFREVLSEAITVARARASTHHVHLDNSSRLALALLSAVLQFNFTRLNKGIKCGTLALRISNL